MLRHADTDLKLSRWWKERWAKLHWRLFRDVNYTYDLSAFSLPEHHSHNSSCMDQHLTCPSVEKLWMVAGFRAITCILIDARLVWRMLARPQSLCSAGCRQPSTHAGAVFIFIYNVLFDSTVQLNCWAPQWLSHGRVRKNSNGTAQHMLVAFNHPTSPRVMWGWSAPLQSAPDLPATPSEPFTSRLHCKITYLYVYVEKLQNV